jgi:hypothetical protein
MHTAITKTPRCRWCDKEPEFTPTVETLNVCEHCGAMQDALVRLSAPGGKPAFAFFVNPDDSLFLEVQKADSETVQYSLSVAQLQKAGVPVLKSPSPLNGRKVDRGLSSR